MKRVFIGGMGRSGTTITLNALYRHGELTAIPIETKFLVEADGFSDLVQALTTTFSTATTPRVLLRFFDLMRNQVTGLTPSPFRDQHDLSSNIFRRYMEGVDELATLFNQRNYFDDRQQVLDATRRFIGITFDDLAAVSDKPGWVEKTPANFWRIDFLRELWPDSYFVHLLRDPRMIMLSLLEKGWLPQDLDAALPCFSDMMRALVVRRRSLLWAPRFVEVRLEDLESTLPETLNGLAASLDLVPFSHEALDGVAGSIERYGHAKSGNADRILFSPGEAARINEMLMPLIVELAYPAEFPAAALR